jgi:hypothetical protein
MKAFDWQLKKKGYIPMAGQIVDASLVPAPKRRITEDEKAAIKAGKSANEIWPDDPAKAAQKDVDARWTLKIGGKLRYRPDGTPLPMIATPVFGYKSHISIDRRFGFIRQAAVTSAAAPDGKQLGRLVSWENTGSGVWADSDPIEIRGANLRWEPGQCLSLAGQRELAGAADADQPHSPAQADGQADAPQHRPGQCEEVGDPRRRRACLRTSENAVRPVHPHHRPGAGRGKTDACQHRLQL